MVDVDSKTLGHGRFVHPNPHAVAFTSGGRACPSAGVEHLYALASKRRLRLRGRCACCTTEAMVAEVKSVPLRELPWEPANWLLYSTFGDGEDRLACLPRLLELTSPGTFERELLQKQLRLALSTREEEAAVHAYLSEEFLEGLARRAAPGASRRVAGGASLVRTPPLRDRGEAERRGPVWPGVGAQSLERAFFLAEEPADQRLFSSSIQVLEWFA